MLLLVVLHLIAVIWGLRIQSTFRFNSIYCALIAHHSMTLLLVNRNRRIGTRFVYGCVLSSDGLYLHHGIKFLTSLLELFLISRVVWIWTNCAHGICASFWANNLTQAANYTGLILDFDVDWIVRINRTAIWHWSLRACTTLSTDAVHLSGWLEYLLALISTTAIHGIIHHASLIKLTVSLTVEWIPLHILSIHSLRSATASRPFQMLTLRSISGLCSYWSLIICDNTATNHTKCTWVFALAGSLLDALVLAVDAWLISRPLPSRRQINNTSCWLHRTHGKLWQVMVGIWVHCGVISRPRRLI